MWFELAPAQLAATVKCCFHMNSSVTIIQRPTTLYKNPLGFLSSWQIIQGFHTSRTHLKINLLIFNMLYFIPICAEDANEQRLKSLHVGSTQSFLLFCSRAVYGGSIFDMSADFSIWHYLLEPEYEYSLWSRERPPPMTGIARQPAVHCGCCRVSTFWTIGRTKAFFLKTFDYETHYAHLFLHVFF